MADLTPRERECLHWVAEGKKAPEIAIILGIRPDTVHEYLDNAIAKLDCVTPAQAAVKMLRLR